MPQLLGKQQPPRPRSALPTARGAGVPALPPARRPSPGPGVRGAPSRAQPAPHLPQQTPQSCSSPRPAPTPALEGPEPTATAVPMGPGSRRAAQREGAGEAPERGPSVELPRSAALPTAPGPSWSSSRLPKPCCSAGVPGSSRP